MEKEKKKIDSLQQNLESVNGCPTASRASPLSVDRFENLLSHFEPSQDIKPKGEKEMFSEHKKVEAQYEVEPFCPYTAGYCDIAHKCEGKSCCFHPDYKPKTEEALHFEFIYDTVNGDSKSEEKVCTRTEASKYFNFLKDCGYTGILLFCKEEERRI